MTPCLGLYMKTLNRQCIPSVHQLTHFTQIGKGTHRRSQLIEMFQVPIMTHTMFAFALSVNQYGASFHVLRL